MSNVFVSTSRSNAKIHAKTIEMEMKQKEIKQQDSATNVSSIETTAIDLSSQEINNQNKSKEIGQKYERCGFIYKRPYLEWQNTKQADA